MDPEADESSSQSLQLSGGIILPERRKLSIRKKLLFTILIFSACLLGMECVVRLIDPVDLGFLYMDGHYYTPEEFVPHNVTNNRQFHDSGHSYKRPDTMRVLLLGDSYVQAQSAAIPEIVGQRLKHYLNAQSRRTYDVISIGRLGWGQKQELQALKKYGAATHPQWVLTLFLSFNDIRNNSEELEALGKEEQATIKSFRPGLMRLSADEAPFLFFRWSALNRLLSYTVARYRERSDDRPIPIDYFVYAKKQEPRWQQAWRTTECLLLSTRKEATKLGARYAIVSASTPHGVLGPKAGLEYITRAYPKMKDYKWDLDQVDKRLERFCKDHQIPFHRLEPVFREKTVKEGIRLHWKYDGHWNKAGNDLAGLEIAKWLLSL